MTGPVSDPVQLRDGWVIAAAHHSHDLDKALGQSAVCLRRALGESVIDAGRLQLRPRSRGRRTQLSEPLPVGAKAEDTGPTATNA